MNKLFYSFIPCILLSFVLSVFFSGCKQKEEKQTVQTVKAHVPFSERVKKLLRERIVFIQKDSVPDVLSDTFVSGKWILETFERNDFHPIWTDDSLLLPAAETLIGIIDSAFYLGLTPSDYHHNFLHKNKIFDTLRYEKYLSEKKICELNLYLTDAFFRLAIDLSKGRLDPDSLNRTWKGNLKDTVLIPMLLHAARHNTIRESLVLLQPDIQEYRELLKLLPVKKDSISIAKLVLNLERWRWEKRIYDDYYILVNLPSFMMKLVECDTVTLRSRIIVGKPETPSPPKLNSKINHFWVYPYWMVPLSIATQEILPALKKDTGYLHKHNMDLLDGYNNLLDPAEINWSKYSENYFPFKIRQRDGDENTLGVLKFIFPNKFDIYMHDTNARGLFKKSKRALSHGCIRVDKAKSLAKRLINCCVINYPLDSLNADLKNKIRKRVNLFSRVPVYIRYFTCEADSATFHIYDDVYGLDEKMMQNLKLID